MSCLTLEEAHVNGIALAFMRPPEEALASSATLECRATHSFPALPNLRGCIASRRIHLRA